MDSKRLIECLTGMGHEPRSYSGRGMYGRKCVGISLDSSAQLWDLAFCLGMELDGSGETVDAPKTDSLGLGIIAYWPQYEWVEVEEEDLDEEHEEAYDRHLTNNGR